jgi:hypothetical protein
MPRAEEIKEVPTKFNEEGNPIIIEEGSKTTLQCSNLGGTNEKARKTHD